MLNFTWWVNRKDAEGNKIFEGGFLGLDNIGVFDRSAPLPTGGFIEQADGTSWMAMYSLNMLTIALELALENPVYEDMATKFFEHFLYIADAMNHIGGDKTQLWDNDDGFFYDVLHLPNGEKIRLKVRSMVGLIPLFAVTTLEPEILNKLPGFKERLEWFITNRTDLSKNVACMEDSGVGDRRKDLSRKTGKSLVSDLLPMHPNRTLLKMSGCLQNVLCESFILFVLRLLSLKGSLN